MIKQYHVYINNGDINFRNSINASSPKMAALIACTQLFNRKGIKRAYLEKGLKKKDYHGEEIASWWGAFIEVTNSATNKTYYYEQEYL